MVTSIISSDHLLEKKRNVIKGEYPIYAILITVAYHISRLLLVAVLTKITTDCTMRTTTVTSMGIVWDHTHIGPLSAKRE